MAKAKKYYMVITFHDGESVEVDSIKVRVLTDGVIAFFGDDDELKAFAPIPTIKHVIVKEREE